MKVPTHLAIVESTVWRDEQDTRAFARALARALLATPGAGHALIALRGDLGAGKTTLVRHLLHALGVSGRIKSPTYGLVETYETDPEHGSLTVWHLDFYRFNDPAEWEHAGLRDVFAGPGLKLVEWPDRAGDRLAPADLTIHIQGPGACEDQASRRVEFVARGPLGKALLEALA